MIKIELPSDIEAWYFKEVGSFFKNSNNHSYKEIANIIKNDLGISFKKLLIMTPDELHRIVGFIKISLPIIPASDKKKLIAVYKSFRSSISSKSFLAKINLKVCPYCNRNYIFNFSSNKKQEATAQLDHFYDKSKYPYLVLCLYNLVPCCPTCNLRKSNKDVLKEPILNPYEDNLHNHIKFQSHTILSIEEIKIEKEGLNFFDEERIYLEINQCGNNDKVQEHIETFNIEPLYERHKDIVSELHQKRLIYSDEYIEELFVLFGGDVFSSKEDLLRLVTCGYIEDDKLNQRPLSKLIKDISEELGFLK